MCVILIEHVDNDSLDCYWVLLSLHHRGQVQAATSNNDGWHSANITMPSGSP
jgi:hypothetical protein